MGGDASAFATGHRHEEIKIPFPSERGAKNNLKPEDRGKHASQRRADG